MKVHVFLIILIILNISSLQLRRPKEGEKPEGTSEIIKIEHATNNESNDLLHTNRTGSNHSILKVNKKPNEKIEAAPQKKEKKKVSFAKGLYDENDLEEKESQKLHPILN